MKAQDFNQSVVGIDTLDLEKTGAEMYNSMNIEAVRAIFRRYREENKRLRSALFTVHTHYHKDIADLETRLQEIESERDFYKRDGHKTSLPYDTESALSSRPSVMR